MKERFQCKRRKNWAILVIDICLAQDCPDLKEGKCTFKPNPPRKKKGDKEKDKRRVKDV